MEEEKVGGGRESGGREGKGESKKRGDKSETSGEKAGCRKEMKGARREIFSLSFFFWNTFGRFGRSIEETIVARRTLRDC